MTCRGRNARIAEELPSILAGGGSVPSESRLVPAFYAARIAAARGLHLSVSREGPDVVFLIQAV